MLHLPLTTPSNAPLTRHPTPSVSLQDVCPDACAETLARLEVEAKMTVTPDTVPKDVEEKANTSDKENEMTTISSPSVNGAFNELGSQSPAALVNVSNNVAATITKVISSPESPQSSTKVLLKCTNIVLNGPSSKNIQKCSSKDQYITKFFTKSPKMEPSKSATNGWSTEHECADTLPVPLTNGQMKVEEPVKTEDDKDIVVAKEEEHTSIPEEVFGLCTADPEICTVHTTDTKRTRWSFYYKEEDIEALINGLNERGERESALKENLELIKPNIESSVKNCPVYLLNPAEVSVEHPVIR